MTTPPTQRTRPETRRAPSIVLVNTGDGKGKTTAAMGTVLRALARGWRVCVVQFVKSGRWHSGEVRLLSELGAEWHVTGDGFTWDADDLDHSADLARAAWALAKQSIESGRFDVVLLDEITYPINWGWIDEADVTGTIASRPAKVNVIVTGRNASEGLVSVADTVSEVRKVKHAFDAGIRAAKGIDF
ncbi:MAG TPA: cob(I)yrinic acid a,c-diamide adenosyltransferase [Acidimicrobiales bacterium]|nr:cob(I)yrinic acid a,c-diamide adenosyltransferase [Acidimicrobiales bacterium]